MKEFACKCSKMISPPNCYEILSPFRDGDDESEDEVRKSCNEWRSWKNVVGGGKKKQRQGQRTGVSALHFSVRG
jgi:hypothetical protein